MGLALVANFRSLEEEDNVHASDDTGPSSRVLVNNTQQRERK